MSQSGLIINPNPTPIKTWEIIQYVTGQISHDINDWPAQMQDAVYAALERLAARVELPVTIISTRCDFEDPYEEGQQGRWYVHIIASEIVAKFNRPPPGFHRGRKVH